jgi:hypothetical protein
MPGQAIIATHAETLTKNCPFVYQLNKWYKQTYFPPFFHLTTFMKGETDGRCPVEKIQKTKEKRTDLRA